MPTIPLYQTAYQPPKPGGAPNVGNVEAAASGPSQAAAIASGVVQLAGLGQQMLKEHRDEQARTERAADVANGLIEAKTQLARVRIENADRNRSPKDATEAVRKATDDFAARWLRDPRNVRSPEAREELSLRLKALAAETEVETLSESLARERQLTEARWEKAANTAVATGDRAMLDAVRESQLAAGEDPELVNLEYEASRDALLQNRFKAELGNFLLTDPTAEQARAFEARLESPEYSEMSDLAKVRMKSAARDYQAEWKAAQKTRQEQVKEARVGELGTRYAAGDLSLDQVYVIAGEDAKLAEEWVGYVNARNEATIAEGSKAEAEKRDDLEKKRRETQGAEASITLARIKAEVDGGDISNASKGIRFANDARMKGLISNEMLDKYVAAFSKRPEAPAPPNHKAAIDAVLDRLNTLVATEKDDLELYAATRALTAQERAGLQIGERLPDRWFKRDAGDFKKLTQADVDILTRDVYNFLTENPNANSADVEMEIHKILFPKENAVARARMADRRAMILQNRRREERAAIARERMGQ